MCVLVGEGVVVEVKKIVFCTQIHFSVKVVTPPPPHTHTNKRQVSPLDRMLCKHVLLKALCATQL